MAISNRKAQKLEQKILLSVIYALLKSGEEKVEKPPRTFFKIYLNKKPKVVPTKAQRIIDIENSYPYASYSLFEDGQLEKVVAKLSQSPLSELLKYDIMIKALLYNDVPIPQKEVVFERLSQALFNDKTIVSTIYKKLTDTYNEISNRSFDSGSVARQMGLSKMPQSLAVSPLKIHPKRLTLNMRNNPISLKKRALALSGLSVLNFEYILTQEACFLSLIKKLIKTEEAYQKIFVFKLNMVNFMRFSVSKEIFEEWYNIKDNELKIQALTRFDAFLLQKVKYYKGE